MVSIIIPYKNAELFLEEALDSIINQSYKNWELILVNDNSIDRSSLKIGDEVEILERGTETVVTSLNPIYIKGIDNSTNTLSLQNKPTLNSNISVMLNATEKLLYVCK